MRTQASINKDILCKRDVLAVIQSTNDKLSRKDISLMLSARQQIYSWNRMVKALKELESEGKIVHQWTWGVAGNWEYRYTEKKGE